MSAKRTSHAWTGHFGNVGRCTTPGLGPALPSKPVDRHPWSIECICIIRAGHTCTWASTGNVRCCLYTNLDVCSADPSASALASASASTRSNRPTLPCNKSAPLHAHLMHGQIRVRSMCSVCISCDHSHDSLGQWSALQGHASAEQNRVDDNSAWSHR